MWRRIDDLGMGQNGAQFRRTKAHRSAAAAAALDGRELLLLARASAAADERARQGAEEGANGFLEFVQSACREEAER
eukprot:9251781-Pyramimonas_sp.AAC.1